MERNREEWKIRKSERLKRWAEEKHDLCMYRIDCHEEVRRKRNYRGCIYTCQIGENVGFEQGMPESWNPRPVLVLSSDFHNAGSETVVVAPLSTKFKWKVLEDGRRIPKIRAHYLLLKEKYPYLLEDSVVKLDKIREVDKVRLGRVIGKLMEEDMNRIVKRLIWLFTDIELEEDDEEGKTSILDSLLKRG